MYNLPDYKERNVQKLVTAFVVFEIELTAMGRVFKLTQNSNEVHYSATKEKLQQGNLYEKFMATKKGPTDFTII